MEPEELKELEAISLIRTEANLEKLPFFRPSKKPGKNQLIYIFKKTVEREGVKIDIEWKVRGDVEYGMPCSFDMDVYRVIMKIIHEQGLFQGKWVKIESFHKIFKEINKPPSGVTYNMMRDSLRRLRAVDVESKGTFYLKGKKKWINDSFNIFGRLIERGEELDDGTIAEAYYLELGSWMIDNLKAGYYKPIDINYHVRLRNLIAKALYAYLDVVFYSMKDKGEDHFEIEYKNLCKQLMIVPQRYKSKAMQTLQPSLDELVATRFLSKYEVKKTAESFTILFFPGNRFRIYQELATGQIGLFPEYDAQRQIDILNSQQACNKDTWTIVQMEVAAQLKELGISDTKTTDIIVKYDLERIKRQITHYQHILTKKSVDQGWLIDAIEKDYPLPRALQKMVQKEEQARARILEEERQQSEQESLWQAQPTAQKMSEIMSLWDVIFREHIEEVATEKAECERIIQEKITANCSKEEVIRAYEDYKHKIVNRVFIGRGTK